MAAGRSAKNAGKSAKKLEPEKPPKKKHAGGAPTKRTAEARKLILEALEVGASYEDAASVGGISYETLNEWRKDEPEFSEECVRARARMRVAALATMRKAFKDDWRAAERALIILNPEQYSPRREFGNKEPTKPTELVIKKRLLETTKIVVDETGRAVEKK